MITYVHPEVVKTISGMDFSMISFEFIPIKDVHLVNETVKQISQPQTDEYLKDIGLTSRSCLVNNLSTLFFLSIIGMVHAIIICFHIRFRKKKEDDKRRRVFAYLFRMFTMNVY